MEAPSDRSMFLKIVLVVLALGATGAGLLVARHQRAQAAHELAAARLRILEADAGLATIRARIAALVSPDGIAEMAAELGETEPLLGKHEEAPAIEVPTSVALGSGEE